MRLGRSVGPVRTIAAAALVCGGVLFLSAAPAGAQPAVQPVTALAAVAPAYPVERGSLSVDGTPAPGNTVTVSGSGFAPGSEAEVTVASDIQSLGTFTADGSGAVTAEVTIPSLDEGSHTLTMEGSLAGGGTLILTATFSVGETLPTTGSNLPIRLAVLGAGLVALGALLVPRRMRRHGWS